jgi:hypothetical protein
MQRILRAVKRQQPLTPGERARLREYIIASHKTIGWEAFRSSYGRVLAEVYQISLPAFAVTADDLCHYLINRPELLAALMAEPLSVKNFPAEFHHFLLQVFAGSLRWEDVEPWLGHLDWRDRDLLPSPRRGDIVYKYETNNPHKEPGLKSHFERLARFSFISRLQSYRYLTRNKAARAKIEPVNPDCLGGIFTNKDKSIYYYIFLTETDARKAENACRLLNSAMYGYEYDEF